MKATFIFTLLALVCVALATNCPDKSTCAGSSTCCQLQDGKYGCCPYKNADCCEDKQHCCPEGYECDLQHGQCVHKLNGVSRTFVVISEPSNEKCGDGSSCPSSDTCCQLESGGYGCCPYPKATCCEDKQHCCPNGYQCDLTHGQCVKQIDIKHMGKINRRANDVDCPDGSACADGNTCCELKSGGYGCCPYSEATCCDDKQHCCPNGYQCDIPHSRCIQSNMNSFVSLKNIKPNESCKDGSACPSGNTCCELESGGYGCCPYPEATCCEDKEHCCPNGYKCDLQAMQCVKQSTATNVVSMRSIKTQL